MKRTTFILLLTILLSSCDRIKEGTVIDKVYEPERYYTMMVPHVYRAGKTTYTTFSYIPMYDDPDYRIEIEGYNKKHKLQDRWIYVEKEMFDTIRTGDWYCIDNRCHVEPNKDQQNEGK